jgi:hypothetical protein
MSNINWSKLSDIKYWLEGIAGNSSLTPIIPINSFIYNLFVYSFGTFAIIGIIVLVTNQFLKDKNPLKSKLPFIGSNFLWMGLLGFLWLTLRQTQVGFLGARIWLLVGAIWFLTIMFFILKYVILYMRLEMQYYSKLNSKVTSQINHKSK